ncbi:MAG: hypothetical protein Q7T55_09155 [Solirubrobacteraceae bacterium]|nr:hypothetical protein [Solirubrobacteraceae bacterium]
MNITEPRAMWTKAELLRIEADEADEKAFKTTDPVTRETYLEVARTLRQMAELEESR